MNLSFETHFIFSCYFIKHPWLFEHDFFHECKMMKKVFTTETFYADFHYEFIKL